MNNEIKNKVLGILKETEKSTTEIASILSRNYYDTIEILEELAKQNFIEKINVGNYTFWKIKNGKEIQDNFTSTENNS